MPSADSQDPRVYLAAERTFLAWIRTGLSLMGFGFVVARFGLFLREIEFSQHPLSLHSARFTLWVGTALILIGVAVNLFSAFQHIRFVSAVKRGTEVVDRPVTMASARGPAPGSQRASTWATLIPCTCVQPRREPRDTPSASATRPRFSITDSRLSWLDRLQLRLANGPVETPPRRVKNPCGRGNRSTWIASGVI